MCMIDVGEKIRYIRETYDVKGNELADILNISKSSISHYEKNDRDVPLRNLVKISNYFDLSLDYILNLTDIKRYEDLKKPVDLKITSERIKQICLDQKWTNVKMAKILNTTESNIRKYKTGQTLILTAFALELASKYNYSLDWLTGRTENKFIKKDTYQKSR